MNKKNIFLAVALFCFAARLQAQIVASQALPPGPLMEKKAPDFSQWTVTTTSVPQTPPSSSNPSSDSTSSSPDAVPANPPSSAAATSQVMTVVKTGNIRHVTFNNSDGNSSDIWCSGVIQVIKRAGWKEPLLSMGNNRYDAARLDFSSGDFTGFNWISAQNFTGVLKISGHDCLVFKDQISTYVPDPNDSSGPEIDVKEPAVAVIDLGTRLPTSLQAGGELSSYKFGQPPTDKLTLPPDVQNVIDAWSKKMQAMLRKPAAP